MFPDLASIAARFWSKVDRTPGLGPKGECWLWTGGLHSDGYGVFVMRRRPALPLQLKAHRVAWLLTFGWIKDRVLHTCDTPACVRPSHLFEGTQLENIADRHAKDRDHHPWGEGNPRAKLTSELVAALRMRAANGESQNAMARALGLSPSTVNSAVRGLTWPMETA